MNKFNYEAILPGYYDKVFKRYKGCQSAWHHIKFNFVSYKLKNTKKHLDVGCGPGTFIGNYMREVKAVGIDLSKKQINYAKLHYKSENNNFKISDGKRFPFKDKYFDSISIIELIEHLNKEEIDQIISESRRCLKDDGEIIITTPNYLSLWPLLEIIVNKVSELSYAEQHISKFNYFSLKKLLIKNKFNIIKIGTFIFVSPFIAAISFKLSKIFSKIRFIDFKVGFLLYAVIKK